MRKAGTVSKPRETIDRRSGFRWNNRQETFSQRAVNLIALVTSTAAICNSGVCIYRFYSITAAYTRGAGSISSPTKEIGPDIFRKTFSIREPLDRFVRLWKRQAALFRYAVVQFPIFHFPSSPSPSNKRNEKETEFIRSQKLYPFSLS